MPFDKNRKLLVSVYNAQEAREAVLGGGRIIDSEDPKSALGNIWPQEIMAISDAVLDSKRGLEVQLSTNIGEDQLLFRRSDTGEAIQKSDYEIAGKASQAAIGVAASMGTRVHPVNLVKVGLDGMKVDLLQQTLAEVAATLQRTEHYSHSQVMSVLFVQDLEAWDQRKLRPEVRSQLVQSHEYRQSQSGDDDRLVFGLLDIIKTNRSLWSGTGTPDVRGLIDKGLLPPGAKTDKIVLNELFPHSEFFPKELLGSSQRTSRGIIQAMVDATAAARAHAIMLDTSVLTKASDICLVDTAGGGMVDFNRFYGTAEFPRVGILSLDDIRFFVDYCHYKGVIANIAGSIDSFQAQMLWALVPELDQLSTRGNASGVSVDPSGKAAVGQDSRPAKVIRRSLVRGLAPPEHGGVLNLPARFNEAPDSKDMKAVALAKERSEAIAQLRQLIAGERKAQGLPPLRCFWVAPDGTATPAD